MKKEPIKCLACSINVEHTEEQHKDYISIWCDKHQSWCGDHTQKSIRDAINHLKNKRSKREEFYKMNPPLNRLP
jgi:hypothetical protein